MANKIQTLLLILFFSISSTFAQKGDKSASELSEMLPAGEFTVEIMDKINPDKRLQELVAKLQTGVQKNPEWFQEYAQSAKPGEMLKYHPNFGMTEEEYDEFISLSMNTEVVSSGSQSMKVMHADSIIYFRSEGKLAGFNELRINLSKNTISYKDHKLKYQGPVKMVDANNGFKSGWKGHSWMFQNPAHAENIDPSNLEKLTITQIKCTIGKLEKNGKVFIKLKEQVVEAGVKVIDTDLPVVF